MKAKSSFPETIGPYRVTGRLGQGGMGEVLRAHDDRLGRPVALKRVRPDSQGSEEALRRFRREAQAVARLSHPSVVQVFDWAEDAGHCWLVMELIDGTALDQLVVEGPLSVERALEVTRDVASGLAEAHSAGIVHRDLKTSNVMVTRRGTAKVLDFGLAKPVPEADEARGPMSEHSALTAEGRVLGTVGSMSPEQALGRPVDHRSDLFSLGVLLYEILSGRPPFDGRNTPEILNRICNVPEAPLHRLDPSIPRGVSDLTARLLEKDPSRRPESAQEVVQEIDRLSTELLKTELPNTDRLSTERRQRTTRIDVEHEPEGLGEPAPEPTDESMAKPSATRPVTVPVQGWPSTKLVTSAALVAMALATTFGILLWRVWPDTEQLSQDGPTEASTGQAAEGEPTTELTKTELYHRGADALRRSDRRADIDAATHDFQAALALDPRFAPALAGLARAYQMDHYRGSKDPQRLEQALAAARQAVELDAHLAVARVALGQVLQEMGRLDEATEAYERALELEPANTGALSGLGRIHGARGELERAEQFLRRAVEADPDDGRHRSFLGGIYYRAGRYDEAAEAFLAHLEEDPESFVALSNLGATYYMQGRLSEAASQFQRALLIEPDPTLYSNVGTIYFTQGLYAQAVDAFQKAIDNGRANDPLMWGNLGDALRWTPGRREAARDAYLRAVQLLHARDPLNLTERTRSALYRAKRGDCDRALAEADRLAGQAESNGGAWYRLAVVREVCGRREAALQALDAALGARFSPEEIQRDPELMDLRQDVRFHELALRRRGSDHPT